ncbi:MAG: dihydroneopterin aldolase [Bacteroidetes bacterium HGW-Bacteroidetes-21]|jgi:dihydroneopterin aldolase|nr:MAG: dihydroneopterin aldolase [Bacteroidetes bacterium HGW-Bacteroidetes-21]
MGCIEIEGMEFYAYHGHFAEEQVVGNRFVVNVAIETDTEKAGVSDDLKDALDYQQVYQIINHEMQQKSFLLEHLAHRIENKILESFPNITGLKLNVGKINPPVGGKVQKVSVTLTYPRV